VSQVKCRKRRNAAVLSFPSTPLRNGAVREALAAFSRTGRRHAVLDLNGLAPELSLLKLLLALRRQAADKQGRLVLCGVSAAVRDWLHATLLLGLFEVRPDGRAALAGLADGPGISSKKRRAGPPRRHYP
jgi:anti-anti-sigma regulatory factor